MSIKVGAIALLSGCTLLLAQDRNALDVQKARNEHVQARRNLVDYPITEFDLLSLPLYQPSQQISGTIRMVGSNYIADSHIGEYWEAGFKKFHPGVKFLAGDLVLHQRWVRSLTTPELFL